MEVHYIPDYSINWHHTHLWTGLLHNAIYIQPHGFLELDYYPVWLIALNEEEDIIMVQLKQSSHLTEDQFTMKIILFAPAAHVMESVVLEHRLLFSACLCDLSTSSLSHSA